MSMSVKGIDGEMSVGEMSVDEVSVEDRLQCPTGQQDGEVTGGKSRPSVVLASDGITAEMNGDRLGQYSLTGEYCGSPYYLQDSIRTDSPPAYLYRADKYQWYVSSVLGKGGGWLKNPSGSVTVPETGWKVADGKGNWLDDPELTARCGTLSECGDITVSSNGPAAKKKSHYLGVYKRTDIISCGRPVFKHQDKDKYLSMTSGNTNWGIGDKLGVTRAYIQSAAGANCPASARNKYSERFNVKSWRYADKNGAWLEDPTITVTCTNHSGLEN